MTEAIGVPVLLSLLLFFTVVVLTFYYCHRVAPPMSPYPATQSTRTAQRRPEITSVVVETGLSREAIESYPKMVFSEAKLEKREAMAASCSICLADYRSSDMVRQLPDCSHFFHRKCVDPWLRLNPSCPVCRKSPYPTPRSTPLAGMVPLASRSDLLD